ncbi:MAG TPA: VTT domain-containing protein [Roseiarcus sp.]|nr:VTT domain-containing protein [Roseiarcus sp.]
MANKSPRLDRRLALGGLALLLLLGAAAWLSATQDIASWRLWLTAQQDFVVRREVAAAALYFLAFLIFSALSLPGAWALSVAGGALFGAWLGPPLVSVSSTAGATLAMLGARYLFRDAVAARFPDFVARVDRGVAGSGARWLFAARLTPIIPFSVVNLAVGLTQMRVTTFALVTMVGASPFAFLYAEAGAKLATIERPSDILSLKLVLLLLALAALPFVAKRVGKRRASTPEMTRDRRRAGDARTRRPPDAA